MATAFKIFLTNQGQWVAQILNGGPTYNFMAVQDVEEFAQAMSGGDAGAVVEAIPSVFTDNVAPQTIYNNLLVNCDEMFYFEEQYVCVVGDSLDEELADVGEFLLEAIALMARRQKVGRMPASFPTPVSTQDPN
jgi:hypothetical protein